MPIISGITDSNNPRHPRGCLCGSPGGYSRWSFWPPGAPSGYPLGGILAFSGGSPRLLLGAPRAPPWEKSFSEALMYTRNFKSSWPQTGRHSHTKGGPKTQKPMDGRQKPFCGENKVDYPLGFCSGMPKTPRMFDSDIQQIDFLGFRVWPKTRFLG